MIPKRLGGLDEYRLRPAEPRLSLSGRGCGHGGFLSKNRETSLLSYNQHRTGGEMYDPICPAANHAVIQRRMTTGAYHKQISFEITRNVDDVPHRMTGDDMRF